MLKDYKQKLSSVIILMYVQQRMKVFIFLKTQPFYKCTKNNKTSRSFNLCMLMEKVLF